MGKGIRQLDGKVAVITGAASGIGRALAFVLRKKGCHLALVDLDANGFDALGRDLRAAYPTGNLSLHALNVADKDHMKALAYEVAEAHGGVHLLINNAGVAYEGSFPQTGLDNWERVMGVNLWGVIYGCHYFMPYLAKVERAHIVNLSSLLGIVGMAGQTVYCTTKFAVRGFSEALWEELRTTEIGLTVVYPGSVATNIMKTADGDDPQLMRRLSDWYEQNAISPHRVAAQIVAAVEKGKPRLLITREVVFADCVKRLLPVVGNRIIGDIVIRVLGLEDMREKRKLRWQQTMIESQEDDCSR